MTPPYQLKDRFEVRFESCSSRFIFGLALMLLMLSSATAQRTLPIASRIRHFRGYPVSVVLCDSVLYYSTSEGELITFDLSNPQSPRQVGIIELGVNQWGLIRDGDRLWARSPNVAKLLDISDRLEPQVVWEIRPDYGWELYAATSDGDLAVYSLTSTDIHNQAEFCIYICDVSNLNDIRIVSGLWSLPCFGYGLLKGNRFYGVESWAPEDHPYVISLDDPVHPSVLFHTDVPASPFAADSSGDLVYSNIVRRLDGRFRYSFGIYDGSRDDSLILIAEYESTGISRRSVFNERLITFMSHYRNLIQLDFTDPLAPDTVFRCVLPNQVGYCTMQGSYVAAHRIDYSVDILSIDDPDNVELHATIKPNDTTYSGVTSFENLLTTSYTGGMIELFDISNPANPEPLDTICLGQDVIALKMIDGYALAVTEDTLAILLTADREQKLHVVSHWQLPCELRQLKANGANFYYLTEDQVLTKVEISEHDAPSLVQLLNSVYVFDVSGKWLYTYLQNGIHCYDNGDPNNLREMGVKSIDDPNSHWDYLMSMKADGATVSFAMHSAVHVDPRNGGYSVRLYSVDFSDPTHPVIIEGPLLQSGQTEPDGFYVECLEKYGSTIIISQDRSFGLWNTAGQQDMLSFDGVISGKDVTRLGDYLYVVGGNVFNVYNCADYLSIPSQETTHMPTEIALSAYPNPFNGQVKLNYTLRQMGLVEIEVFDALGRQVATLPQGYQLTGSHALNWDANRLPSGKYNVVLTQKENRSVYPIVLTK